MKQKHFSHCVPFLPVKNLQETIAFYKHKLGFYNEWFWGDTDAGIQRDELRLLFNKNPEYVVKLNNDRDGLEIVWFVQNLDDIFSEYKTSGVSIVRGIDERPWGMKDFTIRDVNGYCIRVSESVQHER